jgi:hypothetical protein
MCCITLPTLAMFMNATQGVQCKDIGDCDARSTKLASIIKGVPHEFCTLLLVHLCNTLPALAMLMIARCGVTAERQHVDCW